MINHIPVTDDTAPHKHFEAEALISAHGLIADGAADPVLQAALTFQGDDAALLADWLEDLAHIARDRRATRPDLATVVPSKRLGTVHADEYAREILLAGLIAVDACLIRDRHPRDRFYDDKASQALEWEWELEDELETFSLATRVHIARAICRVLVRMAAEWADRGGDVLALRWTLLSPWLLAAADDNIIHALRLLSMGVSAADARSSDACARAERMLCEAVECDTDEALDRVFEIIEFLANDVGRLGMDKRHRILFKWLEGPTRSKVERRSSVMDDAAPVPKPLVSPSGEGEPLF